MKIERVYKTASEKSDRQQQVLNLVSFLKSLPEIEKQTIDAMMTDEQKLSYIDQENFWKRFNSFISNKENSISDSF